MQYLGPVNLKLHVHFSSEVQVYLDILFCFFKLSGLEICSSLRILSQMLVLGVSQVLLPNELRIARDSDLYLIGAAHLWRSIQRAVLDMEKPFPSPNKTDSKSPREQTWDTYHKTRKLQ